MKRVVRIPLFVPFCAALQGVSLFAAFVSVGSLYYLRAVFYNLTMKQIPPVTKNLIEINIIMFFAAFVLEQKLDIDLKGILGLHLFIAEDFHPYQFVTYMFMHGGFTHLFFNMFALYMFGMVLERVWGSKRFLIYYFVTGLGAALIQEIVQYGYYAMYLEQYHSVNLGGMIVPMSVYLNMWNTVGASGAIYGILLAFAMMFPNEKMFVVPIPVPIKAKYYVIIFCLLELFLGLSNNSGDNVAHFAHLGGVLFGWILIIKWRINNKIGGPYV